MPRDLPIGNEKFLIMFNRNYQIADLFYPHVGMENHCLGHPFKFGIFVDGEFSWTDSWKKNLKYIDDTLVTDVVLENSDLHLEIRCNDCIDFVSPIFIRKVGVKNLGPKTREITIFFHQDFHIRSTSIGDTAYFDPVKTRAVIHYKADRYFLSNCLTESGQGIYQYACGVKEFESAQGTWKDAEDGSLSGSAIAQGSVDSVIAAKIAVEQNKNSELYYWIAAGKSYDEVQKRDSFVKERTPEKLFRRTRDFWKLWVSKELNDPADLEQNVWKFYRRCLLVVKSQTDASGAIIAANDSDILQFNKDTYSYVWPRDGSFVTMAMDDAGYHVYATNFFEFCQKTILPQGWFFHKYQPDGSPGSSWHPWIIANQNQLPIQEDQTALVVLSLWNHFKKYRDVDLVKKFYRPIVKNAGKFMVDYRDPLINLPYESYDLWEERRLVLTFTSCAIYAGLTAAANFAQAFGEDDVDQSFRNAALQIRESIIKNLYDPTLGRFLRGAQVENGKLVARDATIDSSLAGVFLFQVLSPDDPMVISTMRQVEDKLAVRTHVGGIARYERDKYQALSDYDDSVPGNPWFVTTLWLADWYIGIAKTRDDLRKARELLQWAIDHSLSSGIMAEQLNPSDGSPVSVSPLTWSHGTFVDTVHRYVRKYKMLDY